MASFITNPPVYILGGGYYNSLQDAYDAPGSPAITMMAQAVDLTPMDFTLNSGKAVSLTGGFDSAYAGSSGRYTTLNGALTLGTGTLTVENLIIK